MAELAREAEHSATPASERRDALTDVATRTTLLSGIDALASAGLPFALVLIEIDKLRSLNDTLGRKIGDRYLSEVAANLVKVAGPRALVARIDGALFAVMNPGEHDVAETAMLANDCGGVVRQTVADRSVGIVLSASVGGVAAASGEEVSAAEWLRRAELALFVSRMNGREGFSLFRPALRNALRERVRSCLECGNFSLRFQPVLTLAEPRAVQSVECYLRWNHPSYGSIHPREFRVLTEEPQIADLLDDFVLAEALRAACRWTEAKLVFGRVSINLSESRLLRPGLADDVRAALAASEVPAKRLLLEVPEEALIGGIDPASVAELQALAADGVGVALDGYAGSTASLDDFAALPLCMIKLDRGYSQDRFAAERLAAIIEGAQARGIDVVTEGIEESAVVERLIDLGCRYGQGYLLRRPMPARRFGEWLALRPEARGTIAEDDEDEDA